MRFIVLSICIYPSVSSWDYCCHSIFSVLFSYLIASFVALMWSAWISILLTLLLYVIFCCLSSSSKTKRFSSSFPLLFLVPFVFQLFLLSEVRSSKCTEVDRWDFHGLPVEQNPKNEVWLYVHLYLCVWLCSCLHAFVRADVYLNWFSCHLGKLIHSPSPKYYSVLYKVRLLSIKAAETAQ